MRETHGILDALPNVDAASLRIAIVDEWLALVSDRRPWHAMALDDRTGSIRGIVGILIDTRYEVDDAARRSLLRRAARVHGEFRRRQQCALHTVADEIALLQDAMGTVMRRGGASRWAIAAALSAVRSDTRSLERSAHGGFLDWDTPR